MIPRMAWPTVPRIAKMVYGCARGFAMSPTGFARAEVDPEQTLPAEQIRFHSSCANCIGVPLMLWQYKLLPLRASINKLLGANGACWA